MYMSRSEANQPKSSFQHFTGEIYLFQRFAEFIYFSHKMDEKYRSWSYFSRTVMTLYVNSLKVLKKTRFSWTWFKCPLKFLYFKF